MLLYNFVFPKENSDSVSELYLRKKGNVTLSEYAVTIQNGEAAFDTYFNAFSSNKYYTFSILSEVIFKITVNGSGTLVICEKGLKGDSELYSKDFSFEKPTEMSVKCGLSEKSGAVLYAAIRTKGMCIAKDMGFYADRKGREVKPAIVICTFRREEYVYKNMKLLEAAGLDIPVLLIDNGHTIAPENIDYRYCKVYQNKNYGGSGGFSRGMAEAVRDGSFTHIILMDDDISLDCVSVQKTVAFLKYLKPDLDSLGIAGGMLERENPCVQYEASAKWDKGKIVHLKNGLDFGVADSLVINEIDEKGNYGAWWYLCMPISVIEKYGLPFPFFIKTDDIEYGVRTLEKVIVMNGIGVWHDSFEGKFSYYLEYYIKRNELVCNAVHERHATVLALKKLFFGLGKCLVSYNYDCVKYILKAFDDYLKGPDFFLNTDEETLNSELRQNAETLFSGSELGLAEKTDAEKGNENIKLLRAITLNGYLIPSCFLKRKNKVIPWACSHVNDFFGYKSIIEYDAANDCGAVRTMKKRWLFTGAWVFVKYAFKLLTKNRRLVLEYRRRIKEITSAEFWCGHLGIDKI